MLSKLRSVASRIAKSLCITSCYAVVFAAIYTKSVSESDCLTWRLTVWAETTKAKLGTACAVLARVVLVAAKFEVAGALAAFAAMLFGCAAETIFATAAGGAELCRTAFCSWWFIVTGAQASCTAMGAGGSAETVLAAASYLTEIGFAAVGGIYTQRQEL